MAEVRDKGSRPWESLGSITWICWLLGIRCGSGCADTGARIGEGLLWLISGREVVRRMFGLALGRPKRPGVGAAGPVGG
jgi:hypothetical protein